MEGRVSQREYELQLTHLRRSMKDRLPCWTWFIEVEPDIHFDPSAVRTIDIEYAFYVIEGRDDQSKVVQLTAIGNNGPRNQSIAHRSSKVVSWSFKII